MINKQITIKTALLSISTLILLSFTACENSKQQESKKTVAVKKENILKNTINIEGMTCEGCESALGQIPSKIDGVISFKASHVTKSAEVEFDKTVTDMNKIKDAVIETGYKVPGYKDGGKATDEKVEKPVPKKAMKCGAGKCGSGM